MPVTMLPASIEALRRIAAGERDVMTSVYVVDERQPETVPQGRAAAAVRMFDRLPKAKQKTAAGQVKTRSGLRSFLTEAVMTPQ